MICSLGLIFSALNFVTSPANTASGAAVESTQLACKNNTKCVKNIVSDVTYVTNVLTTLVCLKLHFIFVLSCTFKDTYNFSVVKNRLHLYMECSQYSCLDENGNMNEINPSLLQTKPC